MRDLVRDAAQAAGLVHRFLDGLARLGLIPRELIQLAPYSIIFVSNYTAVRWTRRKPWPAKLSAAARKITANRSDPISQYL